MMRTILDGLGFLAFLAAMLASLVLISLLME
jgi:hypothetical protein